MAATVTGTIKGQPVRATFLGPEQISGDTDLVVIATELVEAKTRVYLWPYGGGPASFADELIAAVTLAEACDEGTARIAGLAAWNDGELPVGAVA
jgi:hypothetical protein